jgi:hypothetical protein
MPINWGPHYIVPTLLIKNYSGQVSLRETYSEGLLGKELEILGIPGRPIEATNPWYCRKKGTETWIKIGESKDKERDFAVSWDTTKLENGDYEILGFMSVRVKTGDTEMVISRQNIVTVKVKN